MTTTSVSALDFTAIDVETANSSRASLCAVGLTRVRAGEVVEQMSSLVVPPQGHHEFAPRNVGIHGITAAAVADAPSWEQLYPQVMAFIGEDPLVAHNAPFDRSVIQQVSSVYDLDWPTSPWFDTLPLARALLTLGSYSLPFVAKALDLPELDHHEASADALQAARILLALSARAGVSALADLPAGAPAYRLLPRGGASTPGGAPTPALRAPGDFSGLTATDVLAGESVVFTGKLLLSTRAEAQALVEHFGGTAQGSVTRTTTILVAGDLDPRSLRPGVQLSRKLEKAMDLAAKGQPIEVWTEDDFHQRLDVGRDQLEAATREQRVQANPSWLPEHVITQAQALDSSTSYQQWLRAALRHPEGKPKGGGSCIRCGERLVVDGYWLFLERRVCSGDCNQKLKDKAKREWAKLGIERPAAPSYSSSWGRR